MKDRSPILTAGISRRQVYFSIFCSLTVVAGLSGIIRRVFVGFDGLVWLSLATMFAFAWAAIRIIARQKVTDEAVVRQIDAPEWRTLSRSQRDRMKLLDWPLFVAVREREARRLFDEDLTLLAISENGFRLFPVEAEHTAPYFLQVIAQAAAIHGIAVCNATTGVSGPKFTGPFIELDWSNAALEVRDHLRSNLHDGAAVSLTRIRDVILAGFLFTVPADQRHWYFR